jgi:TnpA family transposase
MAAGKIKPSQLLHKLAFYPRQNDLAVALREVGRVERTLFTIEWILDTDMQRRAQIGLNKGEAHHALKNACVSVARVKSVTASSRGSITGSLV